MAEVERDYSCNVCKLQFPSHSGYIDHVNNDKQHEKNHNAFIMNLWFCKKCDYQFESQRLFDRHCESKKHINGQLTSDDLFCNKCNTQCQNKAKWDEHILTRKHTSTKVVKSEEDLFCNKCNTQCHNDYEMNKHVKTKKHLRNTITNGEGISQSVQHTIDQGTQSD